MPPHAPSSNHKPEGVRRRYGLRRWSAPLPPRGHLLEVLRRQPGVVLLLFLRGRQVTSRETSSETTLAPSEPSLLLLLWEWVLRLLVVVSLGPRGRLRGGEHALLLLL